jgi:hypothetical protein
LLAYYKKYLQKYFVNNSFTVIMSATPSGNIFSVLDIVPFEIKEGIYPVKVTKSFLELTMQSFVAPNKINDIITTVNSS